MTFQHEMWKNKQRRRNNWHIWRKNKTEPIRNLSGLALLYYYVMQKLRGLRAYVNTSEIVPISEVSPSSTWSLRCAQRCIVCVSERGRRIAHVHVHRLYIVHLTTCVQTTCGVLYNNFKMWYWTPSILCFHAARDWDIKKAEKMLRDVRLFAIVFNFSFLVLVLRLFRMGHSYGLFKIYKMIYCEVCI